MSADRAYGFRLLTRTDVAALKSLLAVFGLAFEDVATYQDAVPSDAYLTDLLSKDHFMAVVATLGDEVVGGLTAYVLDKFERARREIYIYDLAVAALHRRRGVATGLIQTLRNVAATQGVYVIFVQADLEDAPAIALYASLGVQETAHHFDIAVPPRTGRR